MALLVANMDPMRTLARCSTTHVFSIAFVTLLLSLAFAGKDLKLAIYGLSFWHYYLYWLAYYFGAVSLAVFKRDAILMKTISLLALGFVYLAAPLELLSVIVIAGGFLLNATAAWALGSDRTYYGYEVANLPPRRVGSFPYSWIAHPMLAGNIVAFGGTLLNTEFRRAWWPLAIAHVVLNLGLLAMETTVTPQRSAIVRCLPIRTGCCIVAAIAALAGTLSSRGAWAPRALYAAGAGACVSGYALALYYCYRAPMPADDWPRGKPSEKTA